VIDASPAGAVSLPEPASAEQARIDKAD